MRESNFCNPAQNRASVCISAAVYDRRAIDCTATLPLINSLNHLAYLTSTSPRIREMVTLDGGLERLIRILRTIPRSPSPHTRVISIKEMQAIWKWSLAFQCVVNIGVRGSESVRTRVVEAGMVPVTIRVLESYLRGMEKLKEERKRDAAAQQHRREERRDERSTRDRLEPSTSYTPTRPTIDAHPSTNHADPIPAGQPSRVTPVALPPVPADSVERNPAQPQQPRSTSRSARHHVADETRPITPLESNASAARASVFVGMQPQSSAESFIPPHSADMSGVDSNDSHGSIPLIDSINPVTLPPTASVTTGAPDATPRAISSANIPLANDSSEDLRSHTGEASGSGSEGAEDAEMFADDADDSEIDGTQAPPETSSAGIVDIDQDAVEDRQTPRPVRRALAPMSDSEPVHVTQPTNNFITPNRPTNIAAPPRFERQETVRPSRGFTYASGSRNAESANAASTALAAQVRQETPQDSQSLQRSSHSHHSNRDRDPQPNSSASRTAHIHATTNAAQAQSAVFANSGTSTGIDMIYREEEVLLSLQLLAYLSKYAHVRILFHTSDLTNAALVGPLDALNEQLDVAAKSGKSWDPLEPPKRNVFSVAERFTLRSSRSSSIAYPAPRLSMEIQYWAGVIMRNACRKDESRGGIRQCANMLCGKWEEFPREFAKCRRCRKAKYCSKQCQSKGWQMGHRFWCSAKADDGDTKDNKDRERHSGRTELENININPPLPGVTDPTALHPQIFGLDAQTPRHLHDIQDPMGTARTTPMAIAPGQQQQQQTQDHVQQQHHLHQLHHAQHLQQHHQHAVGHLADPLHRQNGQAQHQPGGNHHVYQQRTLSAQRLDSSSSSINSQHADSGFVNSADEADRSGRTSLNASPSRSALTAATSLGPHDAAAEAPYPPGYTVQRTPGHTTTRWSDGQSRARRIPLGTGDTLTAEELRNRRVSSLAGNELIDNSDMSEDETERRLAQTQGVHPAIAAAAAAVGLHHDQDVPPMAPQRTDLAGRPLPPPVIASHNGDDELALGGRATPGVAGEQDFATGEIDQMLGHWATRRNGAMGRLAEIRAQVPSPDRASSPDVGAYRDSSETSSVGGGGGARSEDEDMTAPRARYHAMYGQHPSHPSPLRGSTPPVHHRMHRPSTGFSDASGQRSGYGESLGEPSSMRYRGSPSSPLAQGSLQPYVASQLDRALHSPGVVPTAGTSERDRVRAASYGGDGHMPMDTFPRHIHQQPPASTQLGISTTTDDVDMEM